MHELAATQAILEAALNHAQSAGVDRIATLYLVLGEMSEMTEDSVRFYWEQISKGTPGEGAFLSFRHVPAELQCLLCNRRYAPAGDEPACPECGSERVRYVAGEEFYLEAIEVERAQAKSAVPMNRLVKASRQ